MCVDAPSPKAVRVATRRPHLMSPLLFLFTMGFWPASAEAQQYEPSAGLGERDVEHIALRLAEQTVLSAKGVRSYSEGTTGVVDVRLTRTGDQFVLVGQQVGVTTLLLMMSDGSEKHFRIEVSDEQPAESLWDQRVPRQENVRLDFYFVQVTRSHDLDVGLRYPSSLNLGALSAGFDFLTQRFEAATAIVEDQALLRLDMAQARGWAKLLRKAAVITENGKRAVFFGGGEVNIAVQGTLATGIHTIDFGSTINVLPRYDGESGRIQVELSADVSDLTDDRGSGAPGRIRSTLNTVVNLELGQAVVLAGLTADSKLQTRAGVPGLSQIPILGLLFGSHRVRESRADNVVFIVPTVMESASAETKKRIDTAVRLFEEYDGKKHQHLPIQKLGPSP